MLLDVSTGEVSKPRAVKKRPESEQFCPGDQFLLRMTATPWRSKGVGYSENSIPTEDAVLTVPTSDDVAVPCFCSRCETSEDSADFAPTSSSSVCAHRGQWSLGFLHSVRSETA